MRLFVALELPGAVQATLAAWCPRDRALRALPAASLHVTLAFLGERGEEDAQRAAATLGPLARPVRALALGDVRWLPARRPRVLAVQLRDGDGALGALQRELAAALATAIGLEPERRPFLAHASVARVRGAPRRATLEPPVGPAPFAAPAVSLMRSWPGAGGPRYEPLTRAALQP